MKKTHSGFSLTELMAALGIMCIIGAIMSFGYRNYEGRYKCHSAAQVLAADIRLQQQRGRRLNQEQGIYFISPTEYRLGTCNGKVALTGGAGAAFFSENSPPRKVDLSKDYPGVQITRVRSYSTPSFLYIGFDPSARNASGEWAPMSGFTGDITIAGGNSTLKVRVENTMEVTVSSQ